jgi:protein-S-isoprenylcysteine O-methyltransferase Ste14
MDNAAPERPRKIVPPMYLLGCIGLIFVLDRFMPVLELDFTWLKPLGRALGLGGIMIIFWPFLAFTRAGTGIVPFSEATQLVTGGMYRVTRNPMYLGMALLLAGAACAAGSLTAFLPLPLFVWIITVRFIVGEERFLEAAFGNEYLAYKARVRRWL